MYPYVNVNVNVYVYVYVYVGLFENWSTLALNKKCRKLTLTDGFLVSTGYVLLENQYDRQC